jgi:hypothetical protein
VAHTVEHLPSKGKPWVQTPLWVGRWPKQCIHMWVNIKMIK